MDKAYRWCTVDALKCHEFVHLPYTHTVLCQDHSLSQVPSPHMSSCMECRIPPVSNHKNHWRMSRSVVHPPPAYTHTALPWAHRTGWGSPWGHSHMARSHLGGTGSNIQTHSGHKKDLGGEQRKENLQKCWEGRVWSPERNRIKEEEGKKANWCLLGHQQAFSLSLFWSVCVCVSECERNGEWVYKTAIIRAGALYIWWITYLRPNT